MKSRCMIACLLAIEVFSLGVYADAFGQEVPSEYQEVLKILAKQGDFKANVLKINIPRKDLNVIVDGMATPTPFGFGGWLAMTRAFSI
jgi:hypothetical protein